MQLFISGIRSFMGLSGIELVTVKRRERIHAYIQAADKARALVAGLLLRQFCGVTDDSQLAYGKNGKPYLKDKGGSSAGGIYFNLSHSGDYVVLAVADNEVGVDIEKVTPYSDAVAARCFTQRELEYLQSKRTNEAFYRLWTAKESVMKASGLGFSLPPETFDVMPMDASAHIIAGKTLFFHCLQYEGHMICCATQDKFDKMEVHYEKVLS